jgi:nitrate reductase beta subunit
MTGTSEKCIACFPKIEQGLQPQCFVNCIGKIRMAGWVSKPEDARPENPIDYLVHVRKVALPLFPQFGLEPNVYYIPPIHAPMSFLHQMFGPDAEAAVKTYRASPNDMDLAGLLALFGSSERLMPRWKRDEDWVIGMDEQNNEIVRVPLREPVHVRPAYDRLYQIARVNCP